MKKISIFLLTVVTITYLEAMELALTRKEGSRIARQLPLQPSISPRGAGQAGVQEEAERLFDIVISTHLGVPENDRKILEEIQEKIEKKDTKSSNPVVTKVLEMYREIFEPRPKDERQQNPEELLAEALQTPTDDVRPQTPAQEVSQALRKRTHTPSKDVLVNQAVQLHIQRQARLLECAKMGKAGELQELIKSGINVDDVKDNDGNTPLALAVTNEKNNTVQMLLNAGAKTDIRNNDGDTPLALAVKKEKKDIAQMLLDAGAKTDIRNNEGDTPLSIGWIKNDQEMIDLLLDSHALNKIEATPENVLRLVSSEKLFKAQNMRGRKLLKQFLTTYSPNMKDHEGNSLVALAAKNQCLETLQFLVENYKTDINSKNKAGQTPLDLAKIESIQNYLKENGALTHVQIMKKSVILVWTHKNDLEGLRRLLADKEFQEDPALVKRILNAPDESGKNALAVAVRKGHEKIVEELVEKYAVEVNILDQQGNTPLDIAIENKFKMIEIFLRSKGAVSQRSESLVPKEKTEEIKKFSPNEANFKRTRDSAGNTELASAVQCGARDTVEKLLHENADYNALNNSGKSVLDIALQKGDQEIIALLKRKGAQSSKDILRKDRLLKYAQEGNLELLKKDISGSAYDIKDTEGNGLLALAAMHGHADVVSFLVHECKIKINAQNNAKQIRTALDFAYSYAKRASRESLEDAQKVITILEDNDAYTFEQLKQRFSLIKHASKGDFENFRQTAIQIINARGRIGKFLKTKDPQGNTLLHLAAKSGELALVKYIVEDLQADTTLRDGQGKNALTVARENNRFDVAEFLASRGQSPRSPEAAIAKGIEHVGNGPLALAVLKGDLLAVSELLRRGTDPNEMNEKRKTPLDLAKMVNNEAIVAELQRSKALTSDEMQKRLEAFTYAQTGQVDLLKKILDQGISADLQDKNGNSLVALAASKGQEETVKFLVEQRKAFVATSNKDKQTPLDLCKDTELALYLKQKGSLPSKQQARVADFVNYAAAGNVEKFQKLVAEIGDDVSDNIRYIKDEYGNSLLALAARYGHVDMVRKFMYTYTFDINQVNSVDQTALDLASLAKHEQIINLLQMFGGARGLAAKALEEPSKNAQAPKKATWMGQTLSQRTPPVEAAPIGDKAEKRRSVAIGTSRTGSPARPVNAAPAALPLEKNGVPEIDANHRQLLLAAASIGDVDEIKDMLDRYPTISADSVRDEEGNTLLLVAVRANRLPAVKLLVEKYDANLNARNKFGQNPFEACIRNSMALRNDQLIEYLRLNGATLKKAS